MEFSFIADGIDAVVIDNFYTEDQLKEIGTELKWLTKPSIMTDEKSLGAAESDGNILTKKNGVFLESVFQNWKHSALISHGITQCETQEFKTSLLGFNSLYKSVFHCNTRCHLVSYYENSNYYKPHKDSFFFTILNYFNVEPKQYTGGEIILYSHNSNKVATVEPKNNRAVVITSCTLHEVKEIKSQFNNEFTGNGRYCSSIFLSHRDSREL